MSHRLRLGAVASLVCLTMAAGLALPGDALGAGATGNAKAIAYYRVAVAKTNRLRSYEIFQTGYVRIFSAVGKSDESRWVWGYGQFVAGYYASNEKIKLVQAGGKVSWLEDTLMPIVPACHTTLCNAVYPIQFYITKTAAYEGIITKGPNASCFTRWSFADVPYRAGSGWWGTFGYFYPMTTVGGLTRITSKYSNGVEEVTETDSINSSTKIFAASTLHFAPGGGHRGYSYKAHYTTLSSAPKPPSVRLC